MSERRRPPAALLFLVIVINIFVADSLVCHPTEYEVNGECCPMCPAGSRVKIDCTEFKSTSCLTCMEGTFTEKPNGLKRCWSCTICDSGSGLTVKKRCTATSDTVCEPLEGFLCTDRTEDNGCAATGRHRSCEPGQYIHQKGTAFTDTQCSACSDGTFSNGSSTTCQPHTQCEELNLLQVTAGTPSADAQCVEKQDQSGIIIAVSLSLLVLLAIGSIGGVLFYRIQKKISQFKQNNSKGPVEDSLQKNRQNGSNGEGTALEDIRGNSRTNQKTEDMKSVSSPEAEVNLLNET